MRAWRFKPQHFAALTARLGWRVAWRRAYRCPCFNPVEGAAAYDCAVCGGVGWRYDQPVEGLVNLRPAERKRYEAQGEYIEGDLVVSVSATIWDKSVRPFASHVNPIYQIGENDTVELLDAETRQNDILERGATDRLRCAPVRVESIIGIIEGQPVDYTGGAWAVGDDGDITWETGSGPLDGARYAVQYVVRPRFVVRRELGASRLHGGDALPKRLVLQRLGDVTT